MIEILGAETKDKYRKIFLCKCSFGNNCLQMPANQVILEKV
jgi:hypothetical protein